MNWRLVRKSIATAVLVASAQAADGHIVASRLGDFYTGALHPLTDLQDLILWGAMGVLAGSLGASKGRWLVLAFPLGLLAGLVLQCTSGLDSPGPAANAGMILVVGLLLASAARIPTATLCVIAFGLALIRGAANSGDFGPDTNRLLFAPGFSFVGYPPLTPTPYAPLP